MGSKCKVTMMVVGVIKQLHHSSELPPLTSPEVDNVFVVKILENLQRREERGK